MKWTIVAFVAVVLLAALIVVYRPGGPGEEVQERRPLGGNYRMPEAPRINGNADYRVYDPTLMHPARYSLLESAASPSEAEIWEGKKGLRTSHVIYEGPAKAQLRKPRVFATKEQQSLKARSPMDHHGRINVWMDDILEGYSDTNARFPGMKHWSEVDTEVRIGDYLDNEDDERHQRYAMESSSRSRTDTPMSKEARSFVYQSYADALNRYGQPYWV